MPLQWQVTLAPLNFTLELEITNTLKHFANDFVCFRFGDQLHILASPIWILINKQLSQKKGEWWLSTVMIWAAMSSTAVGPPCFLKSTVNAAIYQDILEQFMLPSPDKLSGEADFLLSSRTCHLPTQPKVPKAGSITIALLCLTDPETTPTWTP